MKTKDKIKTKDIQARLIKLVKTGTPEQAKELMYQMEAEDIQASLIELVKTGTPEQAKELMYQMEAEDIQASIKIAPPEIAGDLQEWYDDLS